MRLVFKGEGFSLRPVELKDVFSIQRLISEDNEVISEFITIIPNPYSLVDAERFINDCISKREAGHRFEFVIVVNDVIAGMVGVGKVKDSGKVAVGYWVGKAFRGKGLVPRALKLVFDFGFKRFGVDYIYAYALRNNFSSERVMEKVGMKLSSKRYHELFGVKREGFDRVFEFKRDWL